MSAIVDGFRDVLTLAFVLKCLIFMALFGGFTIGVMAIGTGLGDRDDS